MGIQTTSDGERSNVPQLPNHQWPDVISDSLTSWKDSITDSVLVLLTQLVLVQCPNHLNTSLLQIQSSHQLLQANQILMTLLIHLFLFLGLNHKTWAVPHCSVTFLK